MNVLEHVVDVVDGETQGLGHTELPVVVLREVFESGYFSRCHQGLNICIKMHIYAI